MKSTSIPKIIVAFAAARRVPAFLGPPGSAKTAMVRAAAIDELATYFQMRDGLATKPHVHVEEVHLASYSEVDARGYLIPHNGDAVFTRPAFLRCLDQHKYVVLFFDEFMQAPHEVQKAIAPGIIDGRFGDHFIDRNFVVTVVAGNNVEDGSGANTVLKHVINRMGFMQTQAPDPDIWAEWAAKKGLLPECIAFAMLRPQAVFGTTPPDADNEQFCTCRSLEAASDVAKNWPGGITGMVGTRDGLEVVSGLVGKGAAAELVGMVETMGKVPRFEDAMRDPDNTPVPSELSMAYAALMQVVVRADPTKHVESAVQYITRFNPNLTLVGLNMLSSRDAAFYSSAAFGAWASRNVPLLDKMRHYLRAGK